MKRRLAALLLCGLLLVRMAVPFPVKATEYLCFVAAGESILPLTDDTMPFWNAGYLYVSSSIFTGSARDALDVLNIPLSGQEGVILYSNGQGKALRFDAGKHYAYDEDNVTYSPGAIVRGGRIFVPISSVAQFFGLKLTTTKLNITTSDSSIQGDLAWIRKAGGVGTGLSERQFLDAASYSIAGRYEEYVKSKQPQQQPPSQPTTPELVEPPELADIGGKRIYLCIAAGDNTESHLNALDRYGVQAAFFCDLDFLENNGGLLRRMVATGHSIGLLAEETDTSSPPASSGILEQLEAANLLLEQAACTKTRLVFLQNAEAREAAREAGYCCLEPTLDRSAYDLHSAAQAESLMQKIQAQRGDDVTLWLAERSNAAGLRSVVSAVKEDDGLCLAWTETQI